VLGLIFGTIFVLTELIHRSFDFFVISVRWAHEYQVTQLTRDVIALRYDIWNQFAHAWYFPLMLSFLLASLCLATATWQRLGKWWWLAPAAFLLNALRLLGRLLSNFAGQSWLDAFNNLPLYFTMVVVINGMLAAWLFLQSEETGN